MPGSNPQNSNELNLNRQGAEKPRTASEADEPMLDRSLHAVLHENDGQDRERRKKRKRRRRSKRKSVSPVTIVLTCLVAVILVCAGCALAWVGSINSTIGQFESEEERQKLLDVLAPAEAEDGEEAYYVAILGSDSRGDGEPDRSDVTMLARVDPENGTVHLISIPRDTTVTIKDQGTQKINAAYAFGGAAGAVECISEFAGVPISHYIEVHFDGLVNVVDQLGGIWVDIPEDIAAGNGGMAFSAGNQLLDGKAALAFARERFTVTGGDFGRAMAQRMIIEATADRILNRAPAQLPSIVGHLAACVTSDLNVSDMAQLAIKLQRTGLTLYSAACPSYYYEADGVSYVGTMYAEWQVMMRRVDAGLNPEDASAEIPEPQASNAALGAASNGASPHDYENLAANAILTTDDVAGSG